MNRVDGMEALDAVENGMIKLGQSLDIWQNDVVYAALAGVTYATPASTARCAGMGSPSSGDGWRTASITSVWLRLGIRLGVSWRQRQRGLCACMRD